PFNVGQRVDLDDFTPEEARPLAAGLGAPPGRGEELLARLWCSTGSHPYLAQLLSLGVTLRRPDGCDGAAQDVHCARTLVAAAALEAEVARTLAGAAAAQARNRRFARDRLPEQPPAREAVRRLYWQVRLGCRVPDEEQSPLKAHLRPSGAARRLGDGLVVRN